MFLRFHHLQAKKAGKKRKGKRAAGSDEEEDDNSQEDAVAPALRERFNHDAFEKCSKLADAIIWYTVQLESRGHSDAEFAKVVRVALAQRRRCSLRCLQLAVVLCPRQVKSAMLTLRTFAQACATLVSSHVQALVPYLVVRESGLRRYVCDRLDVSLNARCVCSTGPSSCRCTADCA